jgi:homoaconitate hydratase
VRVLNEYYLTVIGSFANITSAAAVAASSFDMVVTDPKPFLEKIDQIRYNSMRAFPVERNDLPIPTYLEPILLERSTATEALKIWENQQLPKHIEGRVQRFGDNVDTDQVDPTQNHITIDNSG